MLGNDGSYEAMLAAPDGTPALDQRKAWYAQPAWAPPDPFTDEYADGPPARPGGPVLLDGRYVVRQAVRHAFTGGVYRARDQHGGTDVILKQARPHTDATVTGQDVRDRRRHEAAMLELFGPTGVAPRLVGLFEQQGDLFLVQEALPGTTLNQWVADRIAFDDGGAWGSSPDEVVRIATGLVDLMRTVHDNGFVLRDFNPSNVMVLDDGGLRLIDLELLARPGDAVVRGYTPGY